MYTFLSTHVSYLVKYLLMLHVISASYAIRYTAGGHALVLMAARDGVLSIYLHVSVVDIIYFCNTNIYNDIKFLEKSFYGLSTYLISIFYFWTSSKFSNKVCCVKSNVQWKLFGLYRLGRYILAKILCFEVVKCRLHRFDTCFLEIIIRRLVLDICLIEHLPVSHLAG